MMARTSALATILTLLLAAANLPAATWTVDPAHTDVQFSVKHMMVSTVHGGFGTFTGTASFDQQNPDDVVFEGNIDATSVSTNNERRDAHLKSADFFDVANYPTITFKSTKSQRLAPGKYAVTGDLTIRGVKKEVTLTMEGLTDFMNGPNGSVRTGANLTTTINRRDFGLNWNKALEAGGVMVSDSVKINVDVELEKSSDVSSQSSPDKRQ